MNIPNFLVEFRWWHGNLDLSPETDAIMALPAGKTITVEVASNIAFTSMGQFPESFWPGGKLTNGN